MVKGQYVATSLLGANRATRQSITIFQHNSCAWIATSLSLLAMTVPLISYANPWIPEESGFKYYTDFGHYNHPRHEREENIVSERAIALLHREIVEIRLQTVLETDNSRTEEDKRRLELFSAHRINEINTEIEQIKLSQQNLYHNPMLYDASAGLEYGYNELYSLGINGSLRRLKSGGGRDAEIFIKRKLWSDKRHILTFAPRISFDKVGSSLILGHSKRFKKKKFRLQTETFGYINFCAMHTFDGEIEYKLENTVGAKFRGGITLIMQTMNHIQPGRVDLYGNILRKQIKLAKEFKGNQSKLSVHIGYFTVSSVSAKRYLGEGYSAGIWLDV